MQVRIFKRLQDHVSVQPDIHVVKATGQYFRLDVRNVLEDERWCLGARVPQDVVEFDDVGASVESLEDFDLAILLFDADWFKDFDHTLLVVVQVGTLEDLRVFASSKLVVDEIVV